MSDDSLTNAIRGKPVSELRRDYCRMLTDWAETDTAVRNMAKTVLSEAEVDGDSYGVPTIEDIVELLVKKVKDQL